MFFKMIGLCVTGLITLQSFAAPQINVPKITPKKSAAIVAKKKFIPSMWRDAAILRNDLSGIGGRTQVPEKTVFYLYHDGESLLAAIWCSDRRSKNGRAFRREPNDNLTVDEAVQIVMGVRGRYSVEVNLGSYEGSYNSQGAVAHFYEFTTNAVGASSRTYNESPLLNPLFKSKVIRSKDGRMTLMRIPFSSIGIKNATGKTLYANFFRFYRGVRYGWYLPSFGNYNSLPFGSMLLLKDGEMANRSRIIKPVAKLSWIKKKKAPTTFKANAKKIKINYYPLLKIAVTQLPPENSGRTLVLQLADGSKKVELPLSAIKPNILRLPLPKFTAGKKFEVKAFLRQRNGRSETPVSRKFTAIKEPEWLGTKVGKDYLDKKVAYPWKTPQLDKGVIKLANSTITYGNMPFPQKIKVAGRSLLNAPIRLIAKSGGKLLKINKLASEQGKPTRVERESKSKRGIEWRSMTDFDGFTVIRLRLKGIRASKLEKLEVRIPLTPGTAQFANPGTTQELYNIKRFGYASNASNQLWVGNPNLGLAFSYDHSPFYSPAKGKQLQVAMKSDGSSELIIRLVTAAGQVTERNPVFQFFLQPTPVRLNPPPPEVNRMKMLWEQWSDYQSYPQLSKVPEILKRTKKAHKNGNRLYVYFGQTVAQNSPYYKDYPKELFAATSGMRYVRGYNPGKGIVCSQNCYRGPGGDIMLDGIDRIIEKTGIDGLYLDGPTAPFHCNNPLHTCSDKLQTNYGDDYTVGRILGHRVWLKRLRGLFDARGSRYPLWSHTGGDLDIATLALCDYYYDGEALSRYRHGYLVEPEKFLICYSGKPFGFRGTFLPVSRYMGANFDMCREAQAWALPHDTEIQVGIYTMNRTFYGVVDRDPKAKFYPYWAEQPHWKKLSSNVQASYYHGKREAMLGIANAQYVGPQNVVFDLSNMYPGKKLQVTSLSTRAPADFDGRLLKATVREGQSLMFHVAPPETDVAALKLPSPAGKTVNIPASTFVPRNKFVAADWSVKGSVPDSNPFGLPFALRSTGNSEAKVTFSKRLPREFTMKLQFAHTDQFFLTIDNVKISFNIAVGWKIVGMNKSITGRISDVSHRAHTRGKGSPNKKIDLTIMIKDDLITVLYDGIQVLFNGDPRDVFTSHVLSLSTKGANNLLAFDVVTLINKAIKPQRIHPIH